MVMLVAGWRYGQGQVEQDHYLEYATVLRTREIDTLPRLDQRLFPGMPVLLVLGGYLTGNMVFAGYGIVFSSVVLSYAILYRLTRSDLAFLSLVFPPVMLTAATLIGTEFPVLALVLGSLLAAKQKRWWWAGLLLGFGVWVRLIALVAGTGIVLFLLVRRRIREAFRVGMPLVLGLGSLLVFNHLVWGAWDVQWRLNPEYGRVSWALVQLMEDIPRAIDWGWWRQVISGVGYLVLLVWISRQAYKNKSEDEWGKMLGWMAGLMLMFIFSLGPTPFLEEFPRFLVPVWPLLWLKLGNQRLPKQGLVWWLVVVSAVVVGI